MRHLLRKTYSQQTCNSTYLTWGKSAAVLLRQESPWPQLSTMCPIPPFQQWKGSRETDTLARDGWWLSSGAAEDGNGAEGVHVMISLFYCPGSWKEKVGRALSSKYSITGYTPWLGGGRVRTQRLSHHWRHQHNTTKHWNTLHSSQAKITLGIWSWTCQMHLGFPYQLVISSKWS